jgi:hypothetical protein
MKKQMIALFMFLVSGSLHAQEATEQVLPASSDFHKSLSVTAGYVPKSEYNALKTTVAYNNFFFKRVGVFTSVEKGLDSDYFTNIYGITGSLHKNVYLFGGIDLFTKHGVFNAGKDCRKSMGIGVIPFNNFEVKGGWSKSVGVTIEAGWRFSL